MDSVPAMRVVVNADDLGLNPAVRRAVETLAAAGTLSSASLLANGPDIEAAARVSGIGLGVHLNVLRGAPLSRPAEVASLVGPDGLFPGDYATLLLRWLSGRIDPAEVEAEWERQIGRVRELGAVPTHLDSEKHVHAWPGLMRIAQRLARRHGIGWVRRPKERIGPQGPRPGLARVAFLRLCALGHTALTVVRWPDEVFGIADQGPRLTPQAFARHCARRRPDVVEIVCNPGDPRPGDPPIPAGYGSLRVPGQWRAEFASLSDPAWRETFARLGAELTHFGRLAGA